MTNALSNLPFHEITNSELRARLQPTVLVRLTAPIEVRPGVFRFAAGTVVMAQFWGAGQIVLNPTDPADFPAAYVYTHALQDRIALVEPGERKGTPVEDENAGRRRTPADVLAPHVAAEHAAAQRVTAERVHGWNPDEPEPAEPEDRRVQQVRTAAEAGDALQAGRRLVALPRPDDGAKVTGYDAH